MLANMFLSYHEKTQLGRFQKTRLIADRIWESSKAHPIIASTILAVATGVAGTAYMTANGIKNAVHRADRKAVTAQASLETVQAPHLFTRHWGVERQGVVHYGHVQMNVEPGSRLEAFNRAMQHSAAPGEGEGGCTTVTLQTDREKSNLVMRMILPETVTLTRSLNADFNTKSGVFNSAEFSCTQEQPVRANPTVVVAPAAPHA